MQSEQEKGSTMQRQRMTIARAEIEENNSITNKRCSISQFGNVSKSNYDYKIFIFGLVIAIYLDMSNIIYAKDN